MPYDPQWSKIYQAEGAEIRKITAGDNLAGIYHIGSTNIPGIMSKPLMGILVTAKDFAKARGWNSTLGANGYTLREDEADHLLFTKGPDNNQTVSLKVAQADSNYARAPLLFDRYLRSHPEVAREYEQLKIKLAKKFPNDRQKYTAGKDPFIKNVIKGAEKVKL